jgi:hypothetical protein
VADEAVIAANYCDWRPVKSRRALQIILEVPLEKQDEVLRTLGPPSIDGEKWVAVCRLAIPPEGSLQAERRKVHPVVLESVLLSKEERWQRWICYRVYGKGTQPTEDLAITALYQVCEISSRKELGQDGVLADEARRRFWNEVHEYKKYYGL